MWVWSKLSARKWVDVWEELLTGNPGSVITEVKGGRTIRVTVYCETERDAITLKESFGGSVRNVKSRDWVAEQALICRKPLVIRDRLIVTDAYAAGKIESLRQQWPEREIIVIPAGVAFGTGGHATTSSCLRMLCDFAQAERGRSWTMIDAGCGTGVLAIAAVKLGAVHADAFDFDEKAVEVARKNCERNGLESERISVFFGDVFRWSPAKPADLVTANLFSTILQRSFPRLAAALKPGGALVVSGILNAQWQETLEAARRNGLVCERVVRRGKWTTARLGHQ
ncbi:MAG: 50S ribosomal protein L11 methyltransferase [Akkermansiaceae bacterium]|nr:50S ribosomal protein L11 methyltransferase [Akkermansiaceae bacterium]